MSGHAWTGSQEFLSLSLPSNAEMLTRAKNTVLFAFLASWNNCIKVESIPLTLIQLYIKDRCGQVCITVIILLARKFRSWAQYKLCGGICKKALPSLTPHLFSMPLQDSDKLINMCQLENHYPGFVLLFVFKWVGDFLKKTLPILENLKMIPCLLVCLWECMFCLAMAPLNLKALNFLKVRYLNQASCLTHDGTRTQAMPDSAPRQELKSKAELTDPF